ncbi:MAG TPA: GNAT family N-acetyltransferase [Acidimicrobiales bacterium]
MPAIREATEADIPAIGRALAAAFEDDPVWRWLVPSRTRWAAQAPRYFEHDAAQRLALHGAMVDDDVNAAALWGPPGHWRASPGDILGEMPVAFRLFRRAVPRALRVLTLMERKHPDDVPHWYLAVIGTDPDHQGKGLGSALIHHVTDRCDEEGIPCYLESSKEKNVPFYARHGFEVTEEYGLPGNGPSLWGMWREPKA